MATTLEQILTPTPQPRALRKRNGERVEPTGGTLKNAMQQGSIMSEEELNRRIEKIEPPKQQQLIVEEPAGNVVSQPTKSLAATNIADHVENFPYQTKEQHDNDPDVQEERWSRQRELARKNLIEALDEEAKYLRHETPEQAKARQRRERREKVFSAIGDGISALSNLYFATKGAPNMYDPTANMSETTRKRWERINKEREVDNDKYLNLQLQKYKMLDEAINDKRTADYKRQQLAYNVNKMLNEAKMAEARARAYEQQGNNYAAQAELNKARTLREDANKKFFEEKTKWVGETQQSIIDKNKASENASNARAKKINNGGSSSSHGNGGDKYVLNGKSYPSDSAYKKAVYKEAAHLGIRTRGKSVDQLASEIEIKSVNKPNPQPAKKAQSSSKPKASNQTHKKSLGLNWK